MPSSPSRPAAAPPYGIPLHLWVLRRPTPGVRPGPDLLLADTAGLAASAGEAGGKAAGGGRDRLDWPVVRAAVLDAWRDRADLPGVSRVVPVVELLDDDVDLAPARYLPLPTPGETPADSARCGSALPRPSG